MAVRPNNNNQSLAQTVGMNRQRVFGNLVNPEDLPKSQVWLNVGIQVGDDIIFLPKGLPLDTMGKHQIRGQNQEWNARAHASNELLEGLVQHSLQTMEPGEEQEVQMVIRIRRTMPEQAAPATATIKATDIASLFSPLPNQVVEAAE